jgi:hypothetical protein
MAGTFPKQEHQSRANEVSRAAGLTLDGGASGGKFFALVAMARCAASAVFFFSRRALFSTSSRIGTARRSRAPEIS